MALGWLWVASVALGSKTLSQEGEFRLIMRIAGCNTGAIPVQYRCKWLAGRLLAYDVTGSPPRGGTW